MADPFAELADGLNEDAKAARKRKAREVPVDTIDAGGASLEADTIEESGAAAEPAEDDDAPESVMAARIDNIVYDAELEARTLSGDIRDLMLDIIRTRAKSWGEMTEDEQRQVSIAVNAAAVEMVKMAVHVIRMEGDGSFYAKLEGYAEKGGIKISMSAPSEMETIVACHNAVGRMVTIRVADPASFEGQKGDPPIDPDQSGLVFEGEKPSDPAAQGVYEGDNSDLAGGADDALAGDTDNPFGDLVSSERVNLKTGMVETSIDGENWSEDRPALEAELAAAREANPGFE